MSGTARVRLEELASEYDGWLAAPDEEAAPSEQAPALPTGPRRFKNPR
ncbi:hypothetical protein [Kribbella deserti]|uniref:Uncharacterized protein n=1 Tax=Kribbella deserti TaxID=1926257 RepID=A0ABV6QUM8_9ACTN